MIRNRKTSHQFRIQRQASSNEQTKYQGGRGRFVMPNQNRQNFYNTDFPNQTKKEPTNEGPRPNTSMNVPTLNNKPKPRFMLREARNKRFEEKKRNRRNLLISEMQKNEINLEHNNFNSNTQNNVETERVGQLIQDLDNDRKLIRKKDTFKSNNIFKTLDEGRKDIGGYEEIDYLFRNMLD